MEIRERGKIDRLLEILHELRKSRTGFTGLAIILFFIILGALAPVITYNDPIKDLNLAADFAMPEWITILPWYRDLPRNTEIVFKPEEWIIQIHTQRYFNIEHRTGNNYIDIETTRTAEEIREQELEIYSLTQTFKYQYQPPSFFILYVKMNISIASIGDSYKVLIELNTPTGKTYKIHDTGYIPYQYKQSTWINPQIISSDFPNLKEMNNISLKENAAKIILSEKGEYRLEIKVLFKPAPGINQPGSGINLSIAEITLKIPGSVYGIMGTNYVGADVWSQFVWGIRQSFLVGILASSVAVALGVVFGMIIGYAGRYTREALLLLVDTIYLIPLLPILLIALIIVGRNIYAVAVIIGLFTWAGLARELGNWILSLRENQYVEVAKALGGSELYVMLKHVLPFTFHLVLFAFIIRIPFSILLEAGLSIIGFGDPFQASWGKMLNEALAGGALISAAWWWITPPIIGLTTLSLGFVFLGFALDEIMNPKLKQEER